MAYEVTFTIPERDLRRADLEFSVKDNDGTIGRLKISQGGVEWTPRYKTHGLRLAWKDFDVLMRENGKSKNGKKSKGKKAVRIGTNLS